MTLIRFKVAGVSFEGRQELIADCARGDPIRFDPEPDNPHDPWAIRVLASSDRWPGELHIGYVPRGKGPGYGSPGDPEDAFRLRRGVQPQRGVHLLLRIYEAIGLLEGPHAWIDFISEPTGEIPAGVRLRFRIDGPALVRDPGIDPPTPPTEAEKRAGRFIEEIVAGHFADFVIED